VKHPVYSAFASFFFSIDSGDRFTVNSERYATSILGINQNLHLPISNLSVYQKGTHYTEIRM